MKMVKKISLGRVAYIIGIIGIIILNMIIPYVSYAKNLYQTVYIGEVESTQEVFSIKEKQYPLYRVKNQIFISLSTLQAIGFEVEEVEGIYYIQESADPLITETTFLDGNEKAYMSKYPVYCGGIRSYALSAEGQLLLPIDILKAFGKLNRENNVYWLEDNFQNELKLLKIDEEGIENKADHIIQLRCKHIYWNGKSHESVEENFVLEIGEKKVWQLADDPKKLYITTVIEEVNEWKISEAQGQCYGQQEMSIFNQYSESIYLNELKDVFPPCIIEGQMLHAVGTLKEKETVEVCRSEKHYYLSVKDAQGNKYQVPYSSVKIIGEKGARLGKATKEAIEDFATLNHVESATNYLIWTDLYRQRTYVLKKDEGAWKLEEQFVCSTGKVNNPTPAGFYEVQYMIPYIGVEKGYRCKYAMVFFRDYMYHSILFDRSGKYIKSGQYELGSKASHGCIRLSEKDSKWMYTHIPVKTRVWIR